MNQLHQAFADLLIVPGLRGLILFDKAGPSKIYRLDYELSTEQVDSLVRGIGQVLRRFRDGVSRVELRYEQGRFLLRVLHDGLTLALLTDPKPNWPLLTIALDEVVRMTSIHRDLTLETFRAGELLRSRVSNEKRQTLPRVAVAEVSSPPRAKPVEEAVLQPAQPAARAVEPAAGGNAFLSLGSVPPASISLGETKADARRDAISEESRQSNENSPSMTEHNLAALVTGISAEAARYLGRSVIANYWRQTRAVADPLPFDVGYDGVITAREPNRVVAAVTYEATQKWAQAFLHRCSLIVIDLPEKLRSSLGDDSRFLLEMSSSFPMRQQVGESAL